MKKIMLFVLAVASLFTINSCMTGRRESRRDHDEKMDFRDDSRRDDVRDGSSKDYHEEERHDDDRK